MFSLIFETFLGINGHALLSNKLIRKSTYDVIITPCESKKWRASSLFRKFTRILDDQMTGTSSSNFGTPNVPRQNFCLGCMHKKMLWHWQIINITKIWKHFCLLFTSLKFVCYKFTKSQKSSRAEAKISGPTFRSSNN